MIKKKTENKINGKRMKEIKKKTKKHKVAKKKRKKYQKNRDEKRERLMFMQKNRDVNWHR